MKKLLALSVGLAALCHPAHAKAMSAGAWLDACRPTLVLTLADWKNLSAEKRLAIRDCQRIAAEVYCRKGFDGTSVKPPGMTPKKNKEVNEALSKACPSPLSLPWGGLHFVVLKHLEQKGGLTFFERWHSAQSIVLQAYKSRWPQCPATRRKLEFHTRQHEMKGCVEAWMKAVQN